MNPYQGQAFRIELTDDAKDSSEEAEGQVPGTQHACIAQLWTLITRFADRGALKSPDQMRDEGDGFYAIRARCGLRAYGWYHRRRRRVFVISHVILKKKKKLDDRDKERMMKNRDNYEASHND